MVRLYELYIKNMSTGWHRKIEIYAKSASVARAQYEKVLVNSCETVISVYPII